MVYNVYDFNDYNILLFPKSGACSFTAVGVF